MQHGSYTKIVDMTKIIKNEEDECDFYKCNCFICYLDYTCECRKCQFIDIDTIDHSDIEDDTKIYNLYGSSTIQEFLENKDRIFLEQIHLNNLTNFIKCRENKDILLKIFLEHPEIEFLGDARIKLVKLLTGELASFSCMCFGNSSKRHLSHFDQLLEIDIQQAFYLEEEILCIDEGARAKINPEKKMQSSHILTKKVRI